jgi:phosphatidylglycerophosphate synthase
MSKLDNKYNNPVDVLCEKIYEPFMEPLHRIGVTPNILTTASMLCGLYSAKLIWDQRPKEAALFFALNYLFDCMDGYMARRFKMESHFGDWYDHITDWLTFGLVGYALFKNNTYCKKTGIPCLIIFGFLIVNTMKWFGCQEKVYNNEIGESISLFKKLCNDPETDLLNTKYFGVGTITVFVICLIYFSKSK